MPAYHSKLKENGVEACSCALLSFKSDIRGPAAQHPAGTDDIIDDSINFYRANALFRNFDVRDSVDRTLIYLSLFIQLCLVRCEKIEDKPTAIRELKNLSQKKFSIPGEPGWTLGGLFASPSNNADGESFRAYFKQAREEIAVRIVDRLYDADGSKNKWWQSFSKRKFLNKEIKE